MDTSSAPTMLIHSWQGSDKFIEKCFEDFQISSLEEKLIDKLGILVEQSSKQQQDMLKQIDELKRQVEILEKEKDEMEAEVKANVLTIDSLQEHLSFSHEQNNQLAKLAKVSNEHSETLKIRNTLAVSLSQIKKLQQEVNEIPLLRKEISTLKTENTLLKEKLCSNNRESLNIINKPPSDGISVSTPDIVDRFDSILHLISDLSLRIDELSSASCNSYTSELEEEIEVLLTEVMDMKLNPCVSEPSEVQGLFCSNFCNILHKNNSILKSRLRQFSVTLVKETTFLLSQLFGIQLSQIKAKVYEIQDSCGANLNEKDILKKQEYLDAGDSTTGCTVLLSQFQSQISLLNQLKQVFQQRKSTISMLSGQYAKLDEIVVKFNEDVVHDIRHQICTLEEKLRQRHEKVGELEIHSTEAVESQLLEEVEPNPFYTGKSESELFKEKRLLNVYMKRYRKTKDEKQKLKLKYNEMTTKCQKIATELSNSASLLLKYQKQCEAFQSEAVLLSAPVDTLNERKRLQQDQIDILCECCLPEDVPIPHTESESLTACMGNIVAIDCQRELRFSKEKYNHRSLFDEIYMDILSTNRNSQCEYFEEALLSIRNIVTEASHVIKWISDLESEFFNRHKKVEEFRKWMQVNEPSCKIEEASQLIVMKVKKQLKKLMPSQAQDRLMTLACTNDSGGFCSKFDDLAKIQMESDDVKKKPRSPLPTGSGSDFKVEFNDPLKKLDTPFSHSLERVSHFLTKSTQTSESSAEDTNETRAVALHKNNLALEDHMFLTKSTQTLEGRISIEDMKVNNTKALHEHNLALEDQISVLSQWNDKHMGEVEELEEQLHCMNQKYQDLLEKCQNQEAIIQQNSNLCRELEEVEDELTTLRNLTNPDLQEELQVKIDTQSHLLLILNETNSKLHKQVQDLLLEIEHLKKTDKVQYMDVFKDFTDEYSLSDLVNENSQCKQHIQFLEAAMVHLYSSLTTRQCILPYMITISVPFGFFQNKRLEKIPDDFLSQCSLLSKYIDENVPHNSAKMIAVTEKIASWWFPALYQKTISTQHAIQYINSISKISLEVLQYVISLQDNMGNTILHYLVATQKFEVLYIFITNSSFSTCIYNKMGFDPLMVMCNVKCDVVENKHLLENLICRSGVNGSNMSGITPLMVAAAAGDVSIVSLLLHKGSNINAQDKDGCTALMFAVYNQHISVIEILLHAECCDLDITAQNGSTVFDIATFSQNQNIIDLLFKFSKS